MYIPKYFILLFLFAVIPLSISNAKEKMLPPASVEEFLKLNSTKFSVEEINIKDRVDLLCYLWFFSNTYSTDLDNREYYYALMLDVYNTIPPNTFPEWQPFSEDEPYDLYWYGSSNGKSLKEQLYRNLHLDRLVNSAVETTFKSDVTAWERRMKNNSVKRQKILVTDLYILSYYRKGVKSGVINIDKPNAAASIAPQKIRLNMPTTYSDLVSFTERMRPAMEENILPHKAEEYLLTLSVNDAITEIKAQITNKGHP